MDCTDLDRLRAYFGGKQIRETEYAKQLISAMSRSVEKFMGRYLEQTSRTTYVDVREGDRVFFLQGYPISSTGLTIVEDAARGFTGSAVSSDDYDTTARALDEGRIEFDYEPSVGPSALKITYTGGLATSLANLIASYPDLVHACERQIAFEIRHQGLLGLDSNGGGTIGESARRQVSLLSWWTANGGLDPESVRVIQSYKSFVMRW